MTRRVLLLEPDETARALIARVIKAEGLQVVAARGLAEVAEEGAFDAALVDELAGDGGVLDEVRRIRRQRPLMPLVVTGTLMTPAILLEVLRLGAADALPKPFSPAELRAAIARVVARSAVGHDQALAFAASITEARGAIAGGAPASARRPLADARAASPFDAEAMALEALVAELEGRDDDADRGYRAALALRREEDTPPPNPSDGLARLALYAAAAPVPRLPKDLVGAPAVLVTDPAELTEGELGRDEQVDRSVTVFLLGIAPDARGVYFRAGGGKAFVVLAAAARAEAIARALRAAGVGPLSLRSRSTQQIDLDRIERLRAEEQPPRAVGS